MPSGIIRERFSDWTSDMNEQNALISLFKHVRDIPYAAVPGHWDPIAGPKKMLELGRGSCTPKHYLLGRMFEMLGFQVRYATFLFSWDDPAIAYPEEVRERAARLPPSLHLALQVNIGDRWVLVDATWDPPLRDAGYSVNIQWDGVSDMKPGVSPISGPGFPGEVLHGSPHARAVYLQKFTQRYSREQVDYFNAFYAVLNTWLDRVRSGELSYAP